MPDEPEGGPVRPQAGEGERQLDERLPVAEPAAADSTVGTGSFFAIGCVILALVVVFLGIAIFIFR